MPPRPSNFVAASVTPPDTAADSLGTNIARNGDGNARGAIGLPEHAVPVATDTGASASRARGSMPLAAAGMARKCAAAASCPRPSAQRDERGLDARAAVLKKLQRCRDG